MLTQRELKDLAFSSIVIALIFSWPYLLVNPLVFLKYLLFVGLGFVAHEMAHKYQAIKLGAISFFVSWPEYLILSLFLKIFLGFTIIVPGATVWAKPFATIEEQGLVAAAGPIASIALAAVFLILSKFLPLFAEGAIINAYIALFNLLPVYPLDGAKILRWDKKIWTLLFILALAIFIVA